MSPIQKYYGEQDPRYGGRLQWPGANGFPFLGDAPSSMRQNELEDLPVCGMAFEHPFDLNDEQERANYNWVRDRIRNGLFRQDYVERRWPPDKEWPVIYLEWTQCFSSLPTQSPIAGKLTNANAKQFTLRRPN